MANTLNLGDGNWATKEDSLLAYNSENNNYKPLPFDFSRGSSATRVNKDGLIETVGSGQPRIDYKDDSKGALLLEPTRTNLITYSEDFSQSYWVKTGASVTSGFTSPDGSLSADLFNINNPSGEDIVSKTFSFISGVKTNISIFVKDNDFSNQLILGISSNLATITYDFSTQTILSSTGSWLDSVNITKGFNGFNRIDFTINPTFNSFAVFQIRTNNQGNGSFYIYGAQLEQGSYATSYIPTSGEANGVTRLADSCSQTVPDGVIGQTEGTMYAEYYFDATIDNAGGSDRDIVSINDGTFNNIIQLVHYGNGVGSAYKSVYLNARLSSSYVVSIASSAYDSGLMKVAGAYKNNDYVLYVNGVQIGTDTNASVPSCSVINFAKITGTETPTPINDLKLYNTRLSNSELQALTTI